MSSRKCDLIIVEPCVNQYGHTVIHRINVINGDYLIPRVIDSDRTVVSQSIEVIEIIKENRPDKVIFDKAGVGHIFYETFIFLVNEDKSMKIDAFGTVYYYDDKEGKNG